ncbi:MAG: AAA family ATPase [Treponema sp.]|nr:AAA family ATPase [Treponema sp.]
MDNANESELKEKLKKLIDERIGIFKSYENLFSEKIVPNKDLTKTYFYQVQQHLYDNYFEEMLEAYKKNVNLFPVIESKYKSILEKLDNQNEFSINYLKLLYDILNSDNEIRNLKNWIPIIEDSLNNILNNELNFQAKSNFAGFLVTIGNLKTFAESELTKLSQLDAFDYFNKPKTNYVIIGANGSGKSSFARSTKKILGKNIVIISAQKVFYLEKITSVSIGKSHREKVWKFQQEDKLYKQNNFNGQLTQDLENVYESLVEDYNECANAYFKENKNNSVKTERKITTLEKVMELWNSMLIHRKMDYENGELNIFTDQNEKYPFMDLSDGEKAVFYYIAHILLAKKDSYIIVDEPENHLHLALVSKIWDTLERMREDCQFIYLTHNLDFANTRSNSQKLWMRSFEPPANWTLQQIPENEDLPQVLYMELLGSRKPILFCEGTNASLDINLYRRLFPNYTVIAVEGHLQVISYTRAFNSSYKIHNNSAIGIIDGDYHTEDEKKKWLSDKIYCIEAQEIENLLCDDLLLQCAKAQFCCDEKTVDNAKGKLFSKLQSDFEKQCVEYATQRINIYFMSNMLKKQKDASSLKNSLNELIQSSELNVDHLIEERKILLQKILDNKDYDLGIKSYNNKGLIALIPCEIEKDYKEKVFIMLDKNPNVLDEFRQKYFSQIPQKLD